jgi:hypothetical protein
MTMVDDANGGPEPSAMLKARVMSSLREEGLIARPDAWLWRTVAAVAAAVVVFVAGYSLGRREPAAPVATSRFVLLLYEDSAFNYPGSAAQAVAEYSAWARRLEERGHLEFADQLGNASESLPASSSAGQMAAQISGMFVIRAATLDEAKKLAAESPHLRYGGTIAVRNIAS